MTGNSKGHVWRFGHIWLKCMANMSKELLRKNISLSLLPLPSFNIFCAKNSMLKTKKFCLEFALSVAQ